MSQLHSDLAIIIYAKLDHSLVSTNKFCEELNISRSIISSVIKKMQRLDYVSVKQGRDGGIIKNKQVSEKEIIASFNYINSVRKYNNKIITKTEKRKYNVQKNFVAKDSKLRIAKCGHETVNYYRCKECLDKESLKLNIDETFLYNTFDSGTDEEE